MLGLGREIAEASGDIAQQIVGHYLEDTGAVAPGAYVNVLYVAELLYQGSGDSGLFPDFANRGLLGALTSIDDALGQRKHRLAGLTAASRGLDGHHPPL